MTDSIPRRRASAKIAAALMAFCLEMVVTRDAVAQARPVAVSLDLYSGDKTSKEFADGLTAAITGDDRFAVVTTLPADGMKIITKDALTAQNDDSRSIAAYDVVLKLGNGKYIDEKTGFCDLAKLTMCGRVVAQDSYDAYQAYMTRHKAG